MYNAVTTIDVMICTCILLSPLTKKVAQLFKLKNEI